MEIPSRIEDHNQDKTLLAASAPRIPENPKPAEEIHQLLCPSNHAALPGPEQAAAGF